MKNIIMITVAVAAMRCFGIAASQAWVEQYVSNYVARSAAEVQAGTTVVSSNGVTIISAGEGAGRVRLEIEELTDAALLATNCAASAEARGITNGCMFVWNGAGAYVNPLGVISCTPTNLVFSGVASVSTNGVERFAGWFDAYGVLIQPHTSLSITNGMVEVHQ